MTTNEYIEIRKQKAEALKYKRQQEIKRRRIYLISFIIGLIFVSITVVNTVVANGDNMDKEICYKSIMVESGDTLWNIAERYYDSSRCTVSEYVDEIKSMNNITSDKIKSGDYIIISYSTK